MGLRGVLQFAVIARSAHYLPPAEAGFFLYFVAVPRADARGQIRRGGPQAGLPAQVSAGIG